MKLFKIAASVGLLFVLTSLVFGEVKPMKPEGNVFYIYKDSGDRLNHYIPSGYMGDYGDVKMALRSSETVQSGTYAIKVVYTAERKQECGWSGVYWQTPANNWGDKKGGYDLSGFKKVKFWARGLNGGEYIDKFMIGGITGQMEEGDTDSASTDSISLTKDWKEYEIDLKGLDLKHMIGGFGFVLNAENNPDGAVFFIDEIRYLK